MLGHPLVLSAAQSSLIFSMMENHRPAGKHCSSSGIGYYVICASQQVEDERVWNGF
jgi:hypothetical protein